MTSTAVPSCSSAVVPATVAIAYARGIDQPNVVLKTQSYPLVDDVAKISETGFDFDRVQRIPIDPHPPFGHLLPRAGEGNQSTTHKKHCDLILNML